MIRSAASPRVDVGLRVLKDIRDGLMVDPEWIVEESRAFTWWPHTVSQTLSASPVWSDCDANLSLISITTDLVCDITNPDPVLATCSVINTSAAAFAVVYDEEEKVVRLVTTMHVHGGIAGWAGSILATYAAMQVHAALQVIGAGIFDGEGRPALTTHPLSGMRKVLDAIANVAEELIVPLGRGPSKFAGQSEFSEVAELLNAANSFASADPNGLTAEFGFGTDTSLITANSSVEHPDYGAGLHLKLTLPLRLSLEDAVRTSCALNEAELRGCSRTNLQGAWHHDEQSGSATVAFSSFVPNALYAPRMIGNAVMVMARRARWAHGWFHPGVPEPYVEAIVGGRVKLVAEMLANRPQRSRIGVSHEQRRHGPGLYHGRFGDEEE